MTEELGKDITSIEDSSILFDIYVKEADFGIDIVRRLIYFSGDITDESSEYIIKRINILLNYDPTKDITIITNSGGGDVYDALGVIDFMESILPVKINSLTYTKVMSGAAYMLCASTGKRTLSKRATIMLHGISIEHSSMKTTDATNTTKHVKLLQKSIIDLLTEHSNKSKTFWKHKLENDFILTAEEALKYELIDEII
jgi:ATP-dependent Clp protease protease subunit